MTEVVKKEPWQIKKALEKKKERKHRQMQKALYEPLWRRMDLLDLDSIRRHKSQMRTPPQVKAGARIVA